MSRKTDKEKKSAASRKKPAAKKTSKKKVAKKLNKKKVTKKTGKKKVTKKKVARKRAAPAKNATPRRVSDQERYEMIQRHAYFLAEARNFEPGHELEDWIAAERFVDEMLKKI